MNLLIGIGQREGKRGFERKYLANTTMGFKYQAIKNNNFNSQ